MLNPHTNVDLQAFNSLRLPARSHCFVEAEQRIVLVQAVELAQQEGWPLLLLGGGSNVVLRGDQPGLCVRIATRGIHPLQQDETWQWVDVEAGEPWHGFVRFCLDHGWYGLENLALIPGTVGASPIQNIGAYGVEVGRFIDSVEVLEIASGNTRRLTGAECEFGYRDSVFKQTLRDRVVILSVRFRLRRQPQLVVDYQGLAAMLASHSQPTPQDLFAAVVELRQSKLPDPLQIPNAGSFFKNPVVDYATYQRLLADYPQLVAYPDPQGMKLAAGWLIDRAGWKGYQQGAVGVHQHQALVLTHSGGGDGSQLLDLAANIQADIQRRFGVALEIEPRIY